MSDDGRPAAPHTLTFVLDRWRHEEPARRAVADVVAAVAATAAAIAALVAASPLDPVGLGTQEPPSGEGRDDGQEALDVRAERLFVDALSGCDVASVCCEDAETPVTLATGGSLVVTLDPVDGSANFDINAPLGSIFGVLPTAGFEQDLAGAALQPGRSQLAAGIVVYGPRTVMAVTWGDGTDVYTLDPTTREFVLARHRLSLPPDAQEYAVNASNARHWGAGTRAYVSDLVSGSLGPRERDFNMRWLASLVAETYRILLRGGIYLYPSDERPDFRHGRIRLVHEANPVAFLCEQAGGTATDGITPVLDLQPTHLLQRTPLFFGSRNKVERVRRYLTNPPTTHEESPLFSSRGLFRT